MPRWNDPDTVTRHLDETERAARQRYIAAHPGQPEPMPTTAGYAPVQDWLDAGEPRGE